VAGLHPMAADGMNSMGPGSARPLGVLGHLAGECVVHRRSWTGLQGRIRRVSTCLSWPGTSRPVRTDDRSTRPHRPTIRPALDAAEWCLRFVFFGASGLGMKIFGAQSPYLPSCPRPTVPCTWCGENFGENDAGLVLPPRDIAFHHECILRQIVGSVAHQEKRCVCRGGSDDEDPPEITKREAARQAMRHFIGQQR